MQPRMFVRLWLPLTGRVTQMPIIFRQNDHSTPTETNGLICSCTWSLRSLQNMIIDLLSMNTIDEMAPTNACCILSFTAMVYPRFGVTGE